MNETHEVLKEINQFRDERNWRQFHNEKIYPYLLV